ncbi:hypothetical protein [Desulfocicer vacuolatum]|uniref:hypothetical protein n=1 Tax=Desulfocicer vacuolatum TaxID=2298 RepID=UPI001BAF44C6|nr:hypothetical protein [Desulfocicer vacuolatum]
MTPFSMLYWCMKTGRCKLVSDVILQLPEDLAGAPCVRIVGKVSSRFHWILLKMFQDLTRVLLKKCWMPE